LHWTKLEIASLRIYKSATEFHGASINDIRYKDNFFYLSKFLNAIETFGLDSWTSSPKLPAN